MSRKNRSKFIAFRLKNNQICKAVFVQYDDAQARQIAIHQPQPAATGTAWTAPAPTPPKASTQPQRIAGQHQRTAEERQHPGERAERETAAPKPRDSTQERERTQDRERTTASACTQGSQHSNQGQQEDRGRPSRPQPMQSPSQSDSRASAAQEMEGRGQRDGREGKEERPENDSKRAPPSLHPRQSQRPGAPAILPAVPAYTDRGQPRRAPENRGINSAFVEYAEPPLTNAAHAIPGEARQGGYFTF